jgi:hypothetical protein
VVSVQLAGFATNLTPDGLAADSQWSWHVQMVPPGRRDRADLWTCWDRCAGSPTGTHCLRPSPCVLRVHARGPRQWTSEHRIGETCCVTTSLGSFVLNVPRASTSDAALGAYRRPAQRPNPRRCRHRALVCTRRAVPCGRCRCRIAALSGRTADRARTRCHQRW